MKVNTKLLIVTVLMLVLTVPQFVFACGTYDSVWGAPPPTPGGIMIWSTPTKTNSTFYNTYDNRESVEATVTADASGNFSWGGQSFHIGISGTVKCSFYRDRYDYWNEYDNVYRLLRDGVFTGSTYTQHVKEWKQHNFNSWVLGNYAKQ